MITISQAIEVKYRQEFHHVALKGGDKNPVRCRANGKCKTWVTRPGEFRLPVKYGLYQCFYITEKNASEWNLV